MIVVNKLSCCWFLKIYFPAKNKVKALLFVIFCRRWNTHCDKIIVKLFRFWDIELINDKVYTKILIILSHPFELKSLFDILVRENKCFKQVFVNFLSWIVFFNSFILQIATDQSICVYWLSSVLLLK